MVESSDYPPAIRRQLECAGSLDRITALSVEHCQLRTYFRRRRLIHLAVNVGLCRFTHAIGPRRDQLYSVDYQRDLLVGCGAERRDLRGNSRRTERVR